MKEIFFDKHYRIVNINDILKFDNGSFYQLISYGGEIYLKCINKYMPLLKVSKLILDDTFVSAIKII